MLEPLLILSPIHKASRQIGLYLEPSLEELDVGATGGHLLSYLGSYAPCSVGELTRVLGLKRSTMTSVLDRLEGQGLLVREVDPDDRRSFILRLTQEGKHTTRHIGRLLRKFEREALSRIRPRDLAGFESVMAAIAEVTQVTVREERTR